MAIESVGITPGVGKDVAVDTVDGKEFQILKLGLGADGALDNLVDAGPQAGSASIPVALSNEDNAVLDAIVAALGTIDTALDLVAGAVAATHMQADVLALPADPLGANADAIVAAGAAGSISAKLRRLTQGVEDLKSLVVLAAGTALIGKVGIDQTTPGTTNKVVADLGATDNAVLDAIALGQEANLIPNGVQADQALAVDDTVGGVQFAAFHADTTHVIIDVQTNDVMVTFDGSAPTSTNGHMIPAEANMVWPKALASAAKWIQVSAAATVHASQLKGA